MLSGNSKGSYQEYTNKALRPCSRHATTSISSLNMKEGWPVSRSALVELLEYMHRPMRQAIEACRQCVSAISSCYSAYFLPAAFFMGLAAAIFFSGAGFTMDSSTGVVPGTSAAKFAPAGTR